MNRQRVAVIIGMVLCGSVRLWADAGNCLEFDGVDDYVNTGHNASLDVGNTLTVEAWVNPSDLSERRGIFSTRLNNAAGSFQLEVGTASDGTNRVAVTGINAWVAESRDNAVHTNQWTHIAYVRSDTSNQTLYVNGMAQQLNQESTTYAFNNNTSDKVIASGTSGGQFFAGQIDALRVWNVARSRTEIRESRYTVLTGSETGLVACYRFDESAGSLLPDQTANGNDGTLINMNDEDWAVSDVPFALDFGDAPTPYPVTLAENGAHHVATGPRLGATRNTETDGTHSADANADGSDEDGVSGWTNTMVGGAGASVTVNVQNAPDGAKLDAWIDWNGDGCWNGEADRVAHSLPVTNGNNTVTFDVPSWAVSGQTFARFRLSTPGGLGAGGMAADGEVEDYRITIAPPTARFDLIDSGHVLASGISTDDGARLYPVDMDGDGDIDLLSCDTDGVVQWYENGGTGAYTTHAIDDTHSYGSIIGMDMDGDGDMDVISVDAFFGHIYWHENDGSQHFTRHTVATDLGTFTRGLTVVDLDGDGDMDIVAISRNSLLWFENNGYQTFTMHTISTHEQTSYNDVAVADLDGDGDLDLVVARDSVLQWHENDGRQNFTAHGVSSSESSLRSVFLADLDGDGNTDILSAGAVSNNSLAWHENDGDGTFTRHVLDMSYAKTVAAADVDGDGDMDLLTFDSPEVVLLLNDGAGNFTPRVLHENIGDFGGVCIADASGDGRLDFFAALNGRIMLYRQIDLDFGDAPAPFPVLLSEDGPRHATRGPRLGGLRDYETDGNPSVSADGDDHDGVDDEDSVSQPGAMRPGQLGASVTVNVQNAPGGAKLDAWIDWNGDGSWHGPYDRIASGLAVTNGDNVITFDVPSWAPSGDTHARFRIGTAGTATVGGYADDGEVEDHLLTISAPTASSATFVTRSVPGATNRSIFASSVGDLDGDGDADVVCVYRTSVNAGYVPLWENDGAQNFTEDRGDFMIGSSLDLDAKPLLVDLDRDGNRDFLVDFKGITWFQSDGEGSYNIHTNVVGLSGSSNYIYVVAAADLDADGDLDIVSGHQVLSYSGQYLWLENDGSQGFTHHGITPVSKENRRDLFAADLDRDGDIDLLTLDASEIGHIAWQENDGAGNFTNHTIQAGMSYPAGIFAADLDGDGDLDVLSASYGNDTVAWHENTGGGVFVYREISTNAPGASKITAADLNGNGRLDVVTIGRTTGEVAVYINLGGGTFRRETIYTHGVSSYTYSEPSISVIDMDGDGDLDIVSSIGGSSEDIGAWVWHENLNLYSIEATAGLNGAISPSGTAQVVEGGTTNFVITPDTYWHVADVTTNGASADAVAQFTWSNVLENGTIHASFAPTLAEGKTPHWWLAEHGLTNGGAYTFDEAELRVMGPHNFTAGEEYIADTDPNDPEDYFRIKAISNGPPITVNFDSSSNRLYSLLWRTNLMEGIWVPVKSQMGIGGADSLDGTNTPAQTIFYQLKVELP